MTPKKSEDFEDWLKRDAKMKRRIMFLGNLTEEQRLSKAVVKIMDRRIYCGADDH